MHFLEILLRVFHVVLAHAGQLLERVTGVRPGVPDRDLSVLGELVNDLHQVLAPLLVHLRQRNADRAPLSGWLETEIGLANRLLDDLHLPLFERRDEECAWLGRGDARDLIELHLLPVHLDAYRVEHVRRRLSGAD